MINWGIKHPMRLTGEKRLRSVVVFYSKQTFIFVYIYLKGLCTVICNSVVIYHGQYETFPNSHFPKALEFIFIAFYKTFIVINSNHIAALDTGTCCRYMCRLHFINEIV